MTSADAVAAPILAALEEAPRRALFVTELALALQQRDIQCDQRSTGLNEAIADLRRRGLVLLVDHAPPDRHLTGSDLRIVAGPLTVVPRNVAERNAGALWNEWLAGFASSHRCC